jgi:hypothetical protein
MTEADANALFLKKLPDQDIDKEALASFLAQLEYLPLAITQAVAFILEHGSTVAEYCRLLQKSESESMKLLSVDLEDGRRYPQIPHSVINTWKVSFDLIKQRAPRAAELLSIMCFLNRQGIPRLLLLGEDDDGVDFIKTLAPLKSFRLIVAEQSGKSFEMHRLVQLSTKAWLKSHCETEIFILRALQLVSEVFPFGTYDDLMQGQQLLPHAEAILTEASMSESTSEHEVVLLERVSRFYRVKGQYRRSLKPAHTAFDTRVQDMGINHPATLTSMSNLASTYSALGDETAAKKLNLQVLELRTEILGEKHPDTLTSMSNLAVTHFNLGDIKQAESLELKVLEIYEVVFGDGHALTQEARRALAKTQDAINSAVAAGPGRY